MLLKRNQNRIIRRSRPLALYFEALESRILLSDIKWIGTDPDSTNLNEPNNWVGGQVPGKNDTAIFDATGVYPVNRILHAHNDWDGPSLTLDANIIVKIDVSGHNVDFLVVRVDQGFLTIMHNETDVGANPKPNVSIKLLHVATKANQTAKVELAGVMNLSTRQIGTAMATGTTATLIFSDWVEVFEDTPKPAPGSLIGFLGVSRLQIESSAVFYSEELTLLNATVIVDGKVGVGHSKSAKWVRGKKPAVKENVTIQTPNDGWIADSFLSPSAWINELNSTVLLAGTGGYEVNAISTNRARISPGDLIFNGTSSTEKFGILTITESNGTGGALDSSLGITLQSTIGTSGNSSLLRVIQEANLGGFSRFAAIPSDPSFIANYTLGTAFTILIAGTISGSFTLPLYNTSSPNSPNSRDYQWRMPLNDTTNFPILASGLDWALDLATNGNDPDSLMLTVVDNRPAILNATASSLASGIWQNVDIAFSASPNATTSFMPYVIQAQGRVDLHDTNGIVFPAANATVGNWNTVTMTGFNSTAPGFYTATVQMQVGSVYNFRVLAETIYGEQFTSSIYTCTLPMPATASGTGLALNFPDAGWQLPLMTVNSGYDILVDEPTATWHVWMRSRGNIFVDQWTRLQYTPLQLASLATFFNPYGDPTEFLAEWTTGTASGYATVTSTGSASPFSTAASNPDYDIWGVQNSGFSDPGSQYAFRNGTESAWQFSTPYMHNPGFFNHAGVLTATGRTHGDGYFTRFHQEGFDTTHVTAPDDFRAFAVTSYDPTVPMAINLSWTDQSDNETGFVVQRGIRVTSNYTDVAWSTIATITGTAYSDEFEFEEYSGFGVTYRVWATNGTADSAEELLGYDIAWMHFYFPPPAPDQDIDIASDGGTLTLTNGTNSKAIALSDIQFLTLNTGTSNTHITIDQSLHLFEDIIFNMTGTGDITLTVAHSTMTFTSDLGLAAPHLTLQAASGAALTLSSNQSLENLLINPGTSASLATDQFSIETITNNGTLSFNSTNSLLITAAITGGGVVAQLGTGATTLAGTYSATGSVYINDGKLAFAPTNGSRQSAEVLLIMSSLTLQSGATLDITNHDLIVRSGSASLYESLIAMAYNFAYWDGDGITSASASASAACLVGIMSGSDYNNYSPNTPYFDGITVLSTDTIIKFTWVGDCNFDGLVNEDDLFQFMGEYLGSQTGNYALGDMNFDGLVNDDDLYLFLVNYLTPPDPI